MDQFAIFGNFLLSFENFGTWRTIMQNMKNYKNEEI